MKKILLLLVCGLGFLTAGAQDIPFKIQKSAVFKDEYKRSSIISVDEDGNGGTVIVRSYSGGAFSSAHGYYFEHYDADMKLIKDFEYELKRGYVMGVFVHGGQVNIVDFLYDKEQKAYICEVSSSSINDFQFATKELFRLSREEVKGSFFGGGYDSDSYASMLINQDKTAFAISVDITDKTSETHKLYSFDADLKLKIEHTFKRDIKDKKFKYESIDVSKDGNTIYLLGKVYTQEKKKKKEGGKYQYELSRITSNDSKTQVFDTDDHFAASLKPVFKKDKVACVGFYSDRKDWRYKGLCYFDLDPVTLEIKTQKFNPFTEQFIIDKYGKDKDKELKNISFRDFFLTKNNDIVFNAEEYYETTTYVSTGNGGGYYRTIYHYDDIVSAKISDSGDLTWARNINKRQATDGDESYISYTSMVKGTDTYFFINTGEKVKKLKNDRIQFGQTSTKRSNLNIIRINENGDFDYQEILDDKDNEVPFMVAFGAISKNGESVYFIGRKGKKKQLLKVTI
ncbi:MAG TPA: hypothetical protein VK623_01250 [Flavobacterium sp.]|nr:hypothetical protein [Flavobacterium sp.]